MKSLSGALLKSAERDTRIKKMVEALIAELQNPEYVNRIDEIVKFFTMFHNYSLMNQILIMLQRPDATFVAGYRKWEQLGRHVKKGEKGIAIFAPIKRGYHADIYAVMYVGENEQIVPDDTLTVKIYSNMSVQRKNALLDELKQNGIAKYGDLYAGISKIDEYDFYGIDGFKVVYVFDIKQTEICRKGMRCYKEKPFTEDDIPTYRYSVSNLEDEQLYKVMYDVANRIVSKVFVERESFGGELKTHGFKGFYAPMTDEIHINAELGTFDRAETLIHESSHALIRKKYNWKLDPEMEEVVVETVAYIVLKVLTGISDEVAKNYIAIWLRNARQTPKALLRYITHVGPLVSDILDLVAEVVQSS